MSENLEPLNPQLLYKIAKEQMEGQESNENQTHRDTKLLGFDKKHREKLRYVLCLTPQRKFDDDAVNVCNSLRKD